MDGFTRFHCLCLCGLGVESEEVRIVLCSLTTTHVQTDGRTQTNPIREPHTYTYTYRVNGHLHRTGCSGRPTRSRPWLLSICGCSALVLLGASRRLCFFPFVRSFFLCFAEKDPRIFVYTYTYASSVRPFVRSRTHEFLVRHGWADPHPHPLLIAFYITIVSCVCIVVSC